MAVEVTESLEMSMESISPQRVRTAMCDQHGFYPFRDLLTGHLSSLDDLALAERFARAVALHDAIVMEPARTLHLRFFSCEPIAFSQNRMASPSHPSALLPNAGTKPVTEVAVAMDLHLSAQLRSAWTRRSTTDGGLNTPRRPTRGAKKIRDAVELPDCVLYARCRIGHTRRQRRRAMNAAPVPSSSNEGGSGVCATARTVPDSALASFSPTTSKLNRPGPYPTISPML